MVPLKCLSNFRRALEMLLINYKISLQLKWCKTCLLVVGSTANQNPTFQITDIELYVLVVTISNQ